MTTRNRSRDWRGALLLAACLWPVSQLAGQKAKLWIPGDQITMTVNVIDAVHGSLEPRFGILLRPNARSARRKQTFPVASKRKGPQWVFAFQIKRGESGQALRKLCTFINSHRGEFSITHASKLALSTDRRSTAFEFAMPHVPATGSLAIAIVGEHALLSNSGPFLHEMFGNTTRLDRRFRDVTKQKGGSRGLVWVDRQKLFELVRDLQRKEGVEVLEQGDLDAWLRLALGR